MDFALSDDQIAMQASAKRVLERCAPLEAVRKAAARDRGPVNAAAGELAALGVREMLVATDLGGLGLGLLDAAIVQEQCGAAAAPADIIAPSMAVEGLMAAGSRDQQAAWLARVVSGEVRLACAVAERAGARDDAGVRSSASGLSGASVFVLGAADATHVMVADQDGRVHIVAAEGPGVGLRALPAIDEVRVFSRIDLDNARSEALVGENSPGRGVDRMVTVGRLLLAADTLGAAQTMLDRAVAYAQERKQFGRVIGSFQAVKHMCAEMAAELEPCRSLVWHAAHALDEGADEAEVMACLAKAHLAEVGTFIARTATEVHGGMGFTDLLGLHFWFKRIGANRQLLGGPERVRHDAARLQGWV
ncbi:acyl-CoA dehydrogenase [bacterium]|nr:acyl-CoA dehydrogenase [bacterium]